MTDGGRFPYKRRIVQIAAAADGAILALAHDGTLWRMGSSGEWWPENTLPDGSALPTPRPPALPPSGGS